MNPKMYPMNHVSGNVKKLEKRCVKKGESFMFKNSSVKKKKNESIFKYAFFITSFFLF